MSIIHEHKQKEKTFAGIDHFVQEIGRGANSNGNDSFSAYAPKVVWLEKT